MIPLPLRRERRRLLFIAVLSGIVFAACSDSGTQPGFAVPAGTWAYVSYDTLDTPLVSGWFTIVQGEPTAVSGEWHFQRIGNPQGIGPQVGHGTYVGGLDGANFWAELQPRYVDNNLRLNGQFTRNHIRGTWTWVSFPGVTGRGAFEAQKHFAATLKKTMGGHGA